MGFTNSPLVQYVRISKNSNPRTGRIRRLTPHCMAGNLSVETCGNVFANKAASSNYGIGSDGRIAMYCEEKNRSWCTSSKDNDHQAVTIEVANNGGAPNWPVSSAAWDSLVRLSVDICVRNGMKKLTWLGTKEKTLAYKAADDEMVITCHRWFAAKACPGNELYNRMGELATTVTKMLSTEITNPNEHPETEETPQVVVETDEKKIWNFLKNKGLSDFAVAGIIGNLFAESSLVPKNLQNAFEKKLGFTDDSYTVAVDNGSYNNFVRDGAGYGLAQWTFWSRKEGLYKLVKQRGKSISDLDTQLDYLWVELNGQYKAMLNKLKAVKSVKEASDIILMQFEKPAVVINGTSAKATAADKNKLEAVKKERFNYSTHFYNMYAEKCKFPYTVRVTCSSLNIRVKPSSAKDSAKNGAIRDRGIYTIIEESKGPGANMWGKLKSGAGWISLDYTEKT